MSELDPVLQKEIEQWAQRVASYCGQATRAVELQDHLHCEIERLMQEKQLQPRQAFEFATQQLGDESKLRKELAKNSTLFDHLCTGESMLTKAKKQPENTKWFIAHALLFAAAIFLSSGLLAGREDRLDSIMLFVLLGLFVATQTKVPVMRDSVADLLKRWSK